MNSYLGVDYGTSMLKVSVLSDSYPCTHLLNLGQDDPFLPVAIQYLANENRFTVGHEAYLQRKVDEYRTAVDFRDRIIAPSDSLEIDGRQVNAISLQEKLFIAFQEKTISALGNSPAAFAFSIPDGMKSVELSSPIALRKAGCHPQLFCREWIAVLAQLIDQIQSDKVLFVSMGYGGTSVSCCERTANGWEQSGHQFHGTISGKSLRESITSDLSNEIVHATRQDTEIPETDQAIADSIEYILRQLSSYEQAELKIDINGHLFSRLLYRDQLSAFLPECNEHLLNLLKTVSDSAIDSEVQIVFWGELSSLLPVNNWFPGCIQLDTDAVAAGAATLCKLFTEEYINENCKNCSLINPETGAYIDPASDQVLGNTIPFLEHFPSELCNAPLSNPKLTLQVVSPQDDKTNISLQGSQFHIGRHQNCDWILDPNFYPQVSAFHAKIKYDGHNYLLHDLDSTNGTFLNDKLVTNPVSLKNSDIIRLGQDDPQIQVQLP